MALSKHESLRLIYLSYCLHIFEVRKAMKKKKYTMDRTGMEKAHTVAVRSIATKGHPCTCTVHYYIM